jgi:peptide/nickel transport system permease protein
VVAHAPDREATDLAAVTTPPVPAKAERRGGPKPWWRQLGLMVPLIWVALVTSSSLFAPLLKHVPGIRLQSFKDKVAPLKPGGPVPIGKMPSKLHWLGTDELGRDIFSRVVWGGRVALAVGIVSVLLALTIGGLLGLLAGYYRGKTEIILNTLVNTLLSFPAIVLVLAIVAFMGNNLRNIVLAIAIVAIPSFARVAYANTLAVAQREYVLAARSLGAKNARILFREVLPNVVLPLAAFALVVTAVAIVAEGGLAFLGASIQKPKPSWGTMINDGRKLLVSKGIWHISMIPVAVMFLTVLSLNLIGDRVRALVDKREAKL